MYAFRWIDWNEEKVARHGVTPEEAEHVVNHARRPFPEQHGEKLFVAGPTAGGRWLQVIFVLDDSETAFVIHARPLNEAERKRFRKRIR
jgi:uncharacterized DUF497 family protein